MEKDIITRIFDATNGGLDVILDYYPQAADCVNKHNAKFKIREERSASASLRLKDGKWRVTDFGGSGHEMDAIEVCKAEEGIQWTSEAIALLAQRYGVETRLSADINKPKVQQRPARPDEVDGKNQLVTREKFTKEELQLLGPLVKEEHCRDMGWSPVEKIIYIKNRVATEVSSTEHYPIFARQCPKKDAQGNETYFYKVYQPWYIGKDGDKSRRFTYMPAGEKPQHYVNGLWELRHAWSQFNEREREKWEADPLKEGKPYKDQKLKEAFICSGERDALCVRSLGYRPLWLNSETDDLTWADYQEITKMVEVIYNIPDLDSTGIERGTRLALRFLDVRTIWLPEDMRHRFRDSRGSGAKDFRDYMGIYKDKGNIRDLMELANPARFWSVRPRKDDGFSYEIDTECLHYFLGLNGFSTLKDDTKKDVQYIRRDGWRVRRVTPRELTQFLLDWCRQRALPREIRNLILNTPKLNTASLERLREVELDFQDFTPHSQYFFFQNSCVEVTASSITDYKRRNPSGHYVWNEKVIAHNWRKADSHLILTEDTDPETGEKRPRLQLQNVEKSPLLGYLINSSRLYWREELETGVDAMATEEEKQAYRQLHKFDLAGPLLTEEQKIEQEQCLLNKIFCAGYMLHRFKSPSRAWMPIGMDYKIDEEGKCNGGSGKSFFFSTLRRLRSGVVLNGRNADLTKNPHWLAEVTPQTDMILVDDCSRYLKLDEFYTLTTGEMTVNQKNVAPFTLDFEESPKIALSTNYVVQDFSPSTLRRLLPVVFSDYYHSMGGMDGDVGGDYRETRTIADDFGRDLYGRTYPEQLWEQDLSVLMECVRAYLWLVERGYKCMPPMRNIIERAWIQDMGAKFEEWAVEYFAEDSGRLDTFVVRRTAFEAFKNYASEPKLTGQVFMKRLQGFVNHSDYLYELNPQDILNGQKRIMRRPETAIPGVTGSVEMIYLRTVKENNRLLEEREKQRRQPVQTTFM